MRERWFLAVLLVLSLALQIAYLVEIRDNPFFESPVLDEAIHYRWAALLARDDTLFPGEPFFRAPLYPYFLSLLFRITGPGFFLPRLIQLLVAACNPLLIYLVGREFLPKNAAAAGAAAFVLYGMTLYFNTGFLIVPILLPLTLLLLLLLARAARGRSARTWFAAGVVFGLTAIARPNILLFGVLLPFWAAFLFSRRRDAIRLALIPLAAGAILPVAPVFLHNLGAGEPVPISWQGGVNFYIGNNPDSDGMTAIAPGTDGTWWGGYRDMIRIAEQETGRPLDRDEVSRYWFRKSFDFLRRSPADGAALFLKKAYLVANDFEVSNNQGIYFFRRYSKIFSILSRFGFGLLLPLAAAGAVLVRWDRRSALFPLFLLSYGASIVLFFVTALYRMPLVLVLSPLVGAALVRWAGIRKSGVDRALIVSFLLFAAVLLLSNSNLYHLDRGKETQGQYNVGVVHLTAGRFKEAIPFFEKALADAPSYRNARYNLGLCYSYLDRLDEARRELEPLVNRDGSDVEALFALATVLDRGGETDEALRLLGEALRHDPGNADALRVRKEILERTDRANASF